MPLTISHQVLRLLQGADLGFGQNFARFRNMRSKADKRFLNDSKSRRDPTERKPEEEMKMPPCELTGYPNWPEGKLLNGNKQLMTNAATRLSSFFNTVLGLGFLR